nr:hypothetical protein [uncultured Agathobacter sp.]
MNENTQTPNSNPQMQDNHIICPNCGFRNSNDFIFCASCNQKLPDHVIIHNNNVPQKKKLKPITAVLIGVLCLFWILVLSSIGSNDNNKVASNTEATELVATEPQSETAATEIPSETTATEITSETAATEIASEKATETETENSEVQENNDNSSTEVSADNSDSQVESDNTTDNQSEENYADADVSDSQSEESYTSDSDSSSTTDYAESDDSDSAAVSDNSDQEQQDMVWVNGTGKKYHRRSDCSNMKNAYQVTVEEAENMGKDPCKKCY